MKRTVHFSVTRCDPASVPTESKANPEMERAGEGCDHLPAPIRNKPEALSERHIMRIVLGDRNGKCPAPEGGVVSGRTYRETRVPSLRQLRDELGRIQRKRKAREAPTSKEP